ncbi:MAG: Rieske (2Fe-2S) protein [Pirellulaceae bacterium]
MVDPKNMSIDEILATCRKLDGEGGAEAAPAPPQQEAPPAESTVDQATVDQAAPAEEQAPAPAAPAAAKDPKQMSVADMLAAARAEKSAGSAPKAAASTEKAASAEKPAAAKPAAGKSAKEMSVAEMMAAARGEKAAAKPAASKPAGKAAGAKAAPKAAAPKAAAKASPKPAAKGPSGPKDTASILAAARGAKAKPGPISKAEAASKGEAAKSKPAKAKLQAPPMPEKPAYAATTPAAPTSDGDASRRGFFAALFGAALGSSLAVGFSSLAVTNLLWGLGLARFMFPNILTEPPTSFKVGFPDEYAPGQVQTKFKAQFGVWIVRYEYDGNPEIYALQSVCTHLGCTPNWLEGEQKFKCPCHGSGFYKDGINFEGPAPRPLERFAIRVADDGQLEVDKSRRFFQEKGEWTDPSSFVPV